MCYPPGNIQGKDKALETDFPRQCASKDSGISVRKSAGLQDKDSVPDLISFKVRVPWGPITEDYKCFPMMF